MSVKGTLFDEIESKLSYEHTRELLQLIDKLTDNNAKDHNDLIDFLEKNNYRGDVDFNSIKSYIESNYQPCEEFKNNFSKEDITDLFREMNWDFTDDWNNVLNTFLMKLNYDGEISYNSIKDFKENTITKNVINFIDNIEESSFESIYNIIYTFIEAKTDIKYMIENVIKHFLSSFEITESYVNSLFLRVHALTKVFLPYNTSVSSSYESVEDIASRLLVDKIRDNYDIIRQNSNNEFELLFTDSVYISPDLIAMAKLTYSVNLSQYSDLIFEPFDGVFTKYAKENPLSFKDPKDFINSLYERYDFFRNELVKVLFDAHFTKFNEQFFTFFFQSYARSLLTEESIRNIFTDVETMKNLYFFVSLDIGKEFLDVLVELMESLIKERLLPELVHKKFLQASYEVTDDINNLLRFSFNNSISFKPVFSSIFGTSLVMKLILDTFDSYIRTLSYKIKDDEVESLVEELKSTFDQNDIEEHLQIVDKNCSDYETLAELILNDSKEINIEESSHHFTNVDISSYSFLSYEPYERFNSLMLILRPFINYISEESFLSEYTKYLIKRLFHRASNSYIESIFLINLGQNSSLEPLNCLNLIRNIKNKSRRFNKTINNIDFNMMIAFNSMLDSYLGVVDFTIPKPLQLIISDCESAISESNYQKTVFFAKNFSYVTFSNGNDSFELPLLEASIVYHIQEKELNEQTLARLLYKNSIKMDELKEALNNLTYSRVIEIRNDGIISFIGPPQNIECDQTSAVEKAELEYPIIKDSKNIEAAILHYLKHCEGAKSSEEIYEAVKSFAPKVLYCKIDIIETAISNLLSNEHVLFSKKLGKYKWKRI